MKFRNDNNKYKTAEKEEEQLLNELYKQLGIEELPENTEAGTMWNVMMKYIRDNSINLISTN